MFSAWAGNYGNQRISDAKNPDTRERLLTAFLSQYRPRLNPGGRLIMELTDAIGDYRVPNDHPYLSIPLDSIYPVRHTPEQVQRCAAAAGLTVVQYKCCTTYSHHPRTSYIFQAA